MGRRRTFNYINLVAVLIASALYFTFRSLPIQSPKALPSPDGFYYVERVVDGDTIKLSGGERVRLVGIDTPEVHYSNKLVKDAARSKRDVKTIQEMGLKASAFAKKLMDGRKVRMEYDVQKKDKYGRTLAYVYLEDGTFVNAKILEEGYGQVMTIPPNVKYADRFLIIEREARNSKRGLWNSKELFP